MFTIEYGLYEDSSFEGSKECNTLYEAFQFVGSMEGLLSYHHIYDEYGNDIEEVKEKLRMNLVELCKGLKEGERVILFTLCSY
jgi:hypothetical protein